MEINTINATLFAKMFLAGAKNLESKKEWINELNVFPVPDGDTGTNMTMTIMAAAKEVAALEDPTMEVLAKAISSGSLRGARGNSGVILSQLFRGFTKGIKKYEEIDVAILAAAFQKAVETAYKAVMKPKEGTILTVAKGAADKALELAENDISLDDFLKQVIEEADAVLTMHFLEKRSIIRLNRLKAPKKPRHRKRKPRLRQRFNSVTVPNLSSCSKKSIHRRRSRSSKDFWSPSVIPSLLCQMKILSRSMYIQTTLAKQSPEHSLTAH